MRFLYFLLFLSIEAQCQVLPIKTYTAKDGLNSNSIYSILRDTRGILWVGTPSGVNWYDGAKFTQPAMQARGGQIYVNQMFEDSRHNIWVLTFYNGLYKYDMQENSFSNYFIDSTRLEANSNNFFDMTELSDHRLLFATDFNTFLFDGKQFTAFDADNKSLLGQITSVAQLPNGDVLIGSTRRLWWYQKKGNGWQAKKSLFEGFSISRLLVQGSSCWVGTNKGLFYFKAWPANGEPQLTKEYLSNITIVNASRDGSGQIWIATANGSFKVANDTLVSFNTENGLPASDMHCVYRDKENNTWFGTEGGLAKLNDEYYRYYNLKINDEFPTIISATKVDNTLWFGYVGGIIKMTGDNKEFITTINNKKAGYIFFIDRDKHGRLWAGTDQGIGIIEGNAIYLQDSLIATAMFEEDNGTIWFGSQDGRIVQYANNKFKRIKYWLPKNDNIRAIYKDKEGNLWIGLFSWGVRKFRIDNDSLILTKEYSYLDGFSNLRVRSFLDDKKGNIIFGSRTNGIYIIPLSDTSNKAVININADKGLKTTWVKGMTQDAAGDILLATNTGLHIISGNDYQHPVIRYIPFTSEKVPLEMNAIVNDGDAFWVGTSGLIKYTPSLQLKDTIAPKVYITQVTIQGKLDSAFVAYSNSSPPASLSYEQNVISFDFVAASLKDESAVRYKYMLEGLDKEYSAPTDRKYISYGRLPPGHYTFKVLAQNSDDVWSASPAVFYFNIAKPFWQSWWFIAAVLILLAAIIYSIYRYRLNQALELERLRMKISTDLHDDIGSTLSSISILSDMVIKDSQSRQSGEMVREIKDNSIMLMEKMDDIVWSINPSNDSLENLLLRIKRFAAQLFEAKGIDYDISIRENIHQVKLPMEHRQHIYLIMKEAINNLVKYSCSSKAIIDVSVRHHSLIVSIRDNGKGFNTLEKYSGNGILSMQNRASLMKAKLAIQSKKENGTAVELEVKIK